ncbi:hypothetical protein PFISCL1PPCAC_4121, partial [Pristionchus fissidentatus]
TKYLGTTKQHGHSGELASILESTFAAQTCSEATRRGSLCQCSFFRTQHWKMHETATIAMKTTSKSEVVQSVFSLHSRCSLIFAGMH